MNDMHEPYPLGTFNAPLLSHDVLVRTADGVLRLESPTAVVTATGSNQELSELYAWVRASGPMPVSSVAKSFIRKLVELGMVRHGGPGVDRLAAQWGYMAVRGVDTIVARDSLLGARVAVLGAGGVGAELARLLAMSGVRRFFLQDFDVASLTNSNRQSFVGVKDVGRLKVDLVADELEAKYPDCRIRRDRTRASPTETADLLFWQPDLVVLALDDPPDLALKLAMGFWKGLVPSIHATCGVDYGSISPLFYVNSSRCCPSCYYEKVMDGRDAAILPWSYGPLNSLVVSVLADRTLRYLTGLADLHEFSRPIEVFLNPVAVSMIEATHCTHVGTTKEASGHD